MGKPDMTKHTEALRDALANGDHLTILAARQAAHRDQVAADIEAARAKQAAKKS